MDLIEKETNTARDYEKSLQKKLLRLEMYLLFLLQCTTNKEH